MTAWKAWKTAWTTRAQPTPGMLIVASAEDTVCTADFTHWTTESAVCQASRQIWTMF